MNRESEPEDFSAQAQSLLRTLKKATSHVREKIIKQEDERAEARRYVTYQQWADTLLSLSGDDKNGKTELTTENIHSGATDRIALNPKLTARQNAQLYYKKSKKGKRGMAVIEEKLADSMATEEKLKNLVKDCESIIQRASPEPETVSPIENLTLRLSELGFRPPEISSAKRRPVDQSGTAFREYRFDDCRILIGKNDAQNDELTTRIARPQDIWMHAAGCSGSHVVICRERNAPLPSPETLRKAASLAVWFSKAKHTSSCEVHYAEARYVHKRRKSPPGEVVMLQYKSLRAAPISPQVYFPGDYEK